LAELELQLFTSAAVPSLLIWNRSKNSSSFTCFRWIQLRCAFRETDILDSTLGLTPQFIFWTRTEPKFEVGETTDLLRQSLKEFLQRLTLRTVCVQEFLQ
jgi:hypothetical protein